MAYVRGPLAAELIRNLSNRSNNIGYGFIIITAPVAAGLEGCLSLWMARAPAETWFVFVVVLLPVTFCWSGWYYFVFVRTDEQMNSKEVFLSRLFGMVIGADFLFYAFVLQTVTLLCDRLAKTCCGCALRDQFPDFVSVVFATHNFRFYIYQQLTGFRDFFCFFFQLKVADLPCVDLFSTGLFSWKWHRILRQLLQPCRIDSFCSHKFGFGRWRWKEDETDFVEKCAAKQYICAVESICPTLFAAKKHMSRNILIICSVLLNNYWIYWFSQG